jgi:hypothetical protein
MTLLVLRTSSNMALPVLLLVLLLCVFRCAAMLCLGQDRSCSVWLLLVQYLMYQPTDPVVYMHAQHLYVEYR